MPRPNKQRSIHAERRLATRIAMERESRGWSIEGLAERMTKAGCPMNGSAIFKVEKGDPPRRIVLDEAVAFAQVFGVSLQELLTPPEVLAHEDLKNLVWEWIGATVRADSAHNNLTEYVRRRPEFEGVLEGVFDDIASQFGKDHADVLKAQWMANALDSDEWEERLSQLRGET